MTTPAHPIRIESLAIDARVLALASDQDARRRALLTEAELHANSVLISAYLARSKA